ncbi:MAG: DegT/DnrJ/EryC1/StrS family aminotransferase [Chloroflexota bacterium]
MDLALVADDGSARPGRPRDAGGDRGGPPVGHPADTAPILEAAARHGVPVPEDASEALGARWVGGPLDGRHAGTAARVGAFSFNGNKLITTGGGGMLRDRR